MIHCDYYDYLLGNTNGISKYTDRLAGRPVTDIHCDSITIEIKFGDFGFIRKTYAVIDNSGKNMGFSEKTVLDIDGIMITFRDKNNMVHLAVWNNNNFAYTIGINTVYDGIGIEEMTEYVRETK